MSLVGNITEAVYAEYQERLTVESDIQGHLEFLYHQVLKFEHPRVIELGVRKGNSTSALLAGVVRQQGTLWSCDIETPQVPPLWYCIPEWTFVQGNDINHHVHRKAPKECEVLFIDTIHSYEHTLMELDAYVPNVVEGGIIALHDTQWSDGDFDCGRTQGCAVADALDDYCGAVGLSWYNRSGSYGMGVVYR